MYPFNYPNYPTIPQANFPTFPQTAPRLVVKQVGSIDEAKNTIVDPLSICIFVDFGTGKIYVKKLGDNGQSEFYSYAQEITRQVDPMTEIRERLSAIEARLGDMYGKSIPDVKNIHPEPDKGASGAAGTENAAE